MCKAPIRLPTGVKVNCRNCEWCRTNRVNDLVGRCLAEQRRSSATLAVTLTYAPGEGHEAVLVYSDVQKFFKRLRSAGYRLRYVVVGEYGSRTGRAHWHCVLFFKDAVFPQLDMTTDQDGKFRFQNWQFWPHGHVYPQVPDYSGFRYLLKYILKHEIPDVAQYHLSVSKEPPIGMEYFLELADEMVAQRIAFHSPEYSFADVLGWDRRMGRHTPRQFYLDGRSRELMCEYYVKRWREVYGELPPETDFLVERYFDPKARIALEANPETLETIIIQRRQAAEVSLAVRERTIREREPVIAFSLLREDHGIAALRRDGTVLIHPNDEGESWRVDVNGKDAEAQLRAVGLCQEDATALADWATYLLRREERRKLGVGSRV